MQAEQTRSLVQAEWQATGDAALDKFIQVANGTPMGIVPEAEARADEALRVLTDWLDTMVLAGFKGCSYEILRSEDAAPALLVDIEATEMQQAHASAGNDGAAADGGSSHVAGNDAVLIHCHYDKVVCDGSWGPGLGERTPVRRDGLLYGRGASHGYAFLSAIMAIKAVQDQGRAHSRVVVLVEGSKQSGSTALQPYLDTVKQRLPAASLVIALDSGGPSTDRLWAASTLRGLVTASLRVGLASAPVHSASTGLLPTTDRIVRMLLARVEEPDTGHVTDSAFIDSIPQVRVDETRAVARSLGRDVLKRYALLDGVHVLPSGSSTTEALLSMTWRPALAVVGQVGLAPNTAQRRATIMIPGEQTVQLALYLPPSRDAHHAAHHLQQLLEHDPPFNAKVGVKIDNAVNGFESGAAAPWFSSALFRATEAFYQHPPGFYGSGGTMPHVTMLRAAYPSAQVLATGAAGPTSNTHDVDENISLDTVTKITCALAHVLHDQHRALVQKVALPDIVLPKVVLPSGNASPSVSPSPSPLRARPRKASGSSGPRRDTFRPPSRPPSRRPRSRRGSINIATSPLNLRVVNQLQLAISGVAVRTTESAVTLWGEYTVYLIDIIADGLHYSAARRYSEFESLDAAVRRAKPDLEPPALPGKRLFTSMLLGTVELRKQELHGYLQWLARHKDLWVLPELMKFLSAN